MFVTLRLATIAPYHSVSLMYGSALGCNVTLCHLVSLIFACALGCNVICCMVLHFDLLQLLHVTFCLWYLFVHLAVMWSDNFLKIWQHVSYFPDMLQEYDKYNTGQYVEIWTHNQISRACCNHVQFKSQVHIHYSFTNSLLNLNMTVTN